MLWVTSSNAIGSPPCVKGLVLTDETDTEVTLDIDGKPVVAKRGESLLNAIINAGSVVEMACGGMGSCHLCRVTLTRGAPSTPPANALERGALGNVLLQQGMRLACQLPVEVGMQVRLPRVESRAERRARIEKARARKGRPGR